MREGDVRSPVPLRRGRDVDVERVGQGMGCATRTAERTEMQPRRHGKGECGSERRRGTKGAPKRGRDAHPARGGDKEGSRRGGRGARKVRASERENGRGREREGGKRDEGKRDGGRFSAAVPSEKGRHAPSNRVDSARIGVAGAVPTSLSLHSGAPMVVRGTAVSPTAMATWCDNGVRYSPSLKIYPNPPSPCPALARPVALFRLATQSPPVPIRNVSFPLEDVRIDYEEMGETRAGHYSATLRASALRTPYGGRERAIDSCSRGYSRGS